jgi:ABC-type transport system involved in multi-copper enzyme maturation permease subunit
MALFAVWYNWILPLWVVAVGAAAVLVMHWLLGQAFQAVFPRTAAIVRTTAKECRSQPMFYAVLGLGIVLVLVSVFLPYNTLGDDIKMMKDTGLMMILVLSIILAVSSAAVSVAEEVEGRTALTVLSKPIGRRQFVIGKMLGILSPVVLYYVILGSFFLCVTSFKLTFEAREMSLQDPPAAACYQEILQTLPVLVLAFFETVVMTALSVAISTRLGMIPNLLICATVYFVGHMLPLIVQSSAGKQPIVAFVGQLLATILPMLEVFNVQAAIASGRDSLMTLAQWLTYLGWAGLFCLMYSTLMLLVALLFFEDRDLA